MAPIRDRLRSLFLSTVFPGVLILANFIAAIAIGIMYPLIRTEADIEVLAQAYQGMGAVLPLSWLVPSVICTVYGWPVYTAVYRMPREEPPDVAKRRMLNAPFVLSLLGVSGWLTGIVAFYVGAFVNDVTLRVGTALRYTLDQLLTGLLVFVTAYYLLEYINRRYFIPRHFPDGNLSAVDGAITVSIRARFYIYYFAAAIFPIFLFYNVIIALEDQTDPASLVLPMSILTVVVVGLGAAVTYLFSKSYATPLGEMEQATEKIRGGDFGVQVRVVSNDEVGHLGEAVNEMAVGLKERDKIKAAHERITHELAVAWRIQKELLPDHLPQVPGWQVAATLEPAKQTSGDFYDFIPLPDGRLGLMVADVTDKGFGAALYMALSRSLLRAYAVEYGTEPELTFDAAHRRILADTNTSQFVTVFYGVLDPSTGTLTYSNAGHNPPYLVAANGNGSNGVAAIRELENTGPPIGLRMFEHIAWERDTVRLNPGDVLVLYSDGITEAEDVGEELFEEERLLEVVQANVERSAEGIQEAIITEVQRFVGAAPQSDDMTLMVLVRR